MMGTTSNLMENLQIYVEKEDYNEKFYSWFKETIMIIKVKITYQNQ